MFLSSMEPAFHIALPVLIVLALGVPVDVALVLAPLSLLFDLDLFFGPHRRFHSLVVLGVMIVPTAVLVKVVFPNILPYFMVGLFYAGTHLLLDIFEGEVALFYPLSPKGYGLRLKMRIDNTPVRIGTIRLGVRIAPEIEERNGSYTLLSGQGAVVVLLAGVVIISRIWGFI